MIVAEISKNWCRPKPGEPMQPVTLGDTINTLFENVIEVNRQRGYKLHSFQIHRVMVDFDNLNETIIAVFEYARPRHSHIAGSENPDRCRACGRDIRDEIHLSQDEGRES